MNSSSAFSNVLSAPVSPQKNTPAARGLGDGGDGPAFTQALADQRAEQTVKSKEPSPKKLAASEKPLESKAAADDKVKAAAGGQKSGLSPEQAEQSKGEDAQQELVATTEGYPQRVDPLLAVVVTPLGGQFTTEIEAPATHTELTLDTSVASADTLVGVGQAIVGNTSEVLVSEADVQLPAPLSQPQPQPEQEFAAPLLAVAEMGTAPAAAADPALKAALNPAGVGQVAEAVVTAAGQNTLKNGQEKPVVANPIPVAETEGALLTGGDQTPAEDPQVVFEKMLQAIAGNATAKEAASGAGQKSVELAAAQVALAGESSPVAVAAEGLSRAVEATLPTARNFVVQTAVPVSVGQPQWSQAVGEKVLWLAAQNVQSAEIRLDPPELGPMQVRVHVQQEQASVTFTSHNPQVREQLDQSLNRLRDMFNEQGLNLVNVDVSDKSFQRHQGEGGEQQGQASREQEQEEEVVQAISAIAPQRLVDHYA